MGAQNQEDGVARLKRVILIGDHHQLPPVVKNMAFQKYSHLDQSLFTRFVRLGTPYTQLNAQARHHTLLSLSPEGRVASIDRTKRQMSLQLEMHEKQLPICDPGAAPVPIIIPF